MNARTDTRLASAPCRCTVVLATSLGTALLAGLLMLGSGAPLQDLLPALATDGAPPPAATIHAGVDWQRTDRAPEPAGASVAAYDHPPAVATPARR